jgi:hypothetical protein
MRQPPLDVILSWPKPNYVDPETRGDALLVVNVLFLAICFIAVAARLWARLRILHSAGLDDLLITIAMVRLVQSFFGILANKFLDPYCGRNCKCDYR